MGFNNFKADGSTTVGTRRGALSRTSDRAAAAPPSPHKMPLRVEGSASDSTRTSRGPRDGMLMLCPFCSELVPKARAAAHLQTIACQARAHEREEEVLRRQQEAAACSDEASECETEEAVHARGQDIGGHTKNCGRQWPCEPAAARSVDDEARARPWFAFGPLATIYEVERKSVTWNTPPLAKELPNSRLAKNLGSSPPSSCRQPLSRRGGGTQEAATGKKAAASGAPSIFGWRLESIFRRAA